MKYLLPALLLLVGCSPIQESVADLMRAKAAATLARHVALSDTQPDVAPDEPSSHPRNECPTNGWITHGDGHRTRCPDCDPPYTESIQAAAVKNALIEMHTEPWCPPCQRWKANEQPRLEAAGWTVTHHKPEAGRSIPYFDVWVRGKVARHSGYMSMSALRQIMEALGERPKGSQPASAATVSHRAVSDSYTPRWTYPGSLSTHLQGWPHNIDTTGMTHDEMERYHDTHHDRIGPITAGQIAANSGSNCPSGNCPTTSTRRRWGLFR